MMGDLFNYYYFNLNAYALESHLWCNTHCGMVNYINLSESCSYFSTMDQGWKPLGALKAFTLYSTDLI